MAQKTDPDVIRRAQEGDEQALTTLYHAWRQPVYNYFYYRVGDLYAAEDLTTDCFMRVIDYLDGYQPGGAPFQAWLFQIARNLAVDYFRRQSVRQHDPLDETIRSNGERPEHYAARTLTAEAVQRALARLTDGQRDVIVLRFLADLPVAEVAHILEKSESAVKSLQSRGLSTLQQLLAYREEAHHESTE